MSDEHDTGNWDENRKLVLSELKRQQRWCGELQEKVQQLSVELAVLKTKVAMYAAIGASLVMGIKEIVLAWLK